MVSNHERKTEGNLFYRLKQRFPTLLVGLAVLTVAAVLLGGRSLAVGATAQNTESPQSGQSANANVEDNVNNTANKNTEQAVAATVEDDVQYVTSSLSGGRYESITVQQGIPVKWTINVPSGALNGCNNSIIIPEYDLQIELKTGENVIEFTPDKAGTFAFSCWMGMIRSSISVVDTDGIVPPTQNDGSDQLPAGCCG